MLFTAYWVLLEPVHFNTGEACCVVHMEPFSGLATCKDTANTFVWVFALAR